MTTRTPDSMTKPMTTSMEMPIATARSVRPHIEADQSRIACGCLLEPRSTWHVLRAGLVALVAVLAAVLTAPAVAAAPSDPDQLPAALQKYVVGSPAWLAAPWMTEPSCRDNGGDFSLWVENVIADTPALLTFFQSSAFGDHVPAQDRSRRDAILAGYRTLANKGAHVPAGYCVNDIKRWTGDNPEMKPFGFAWGTDHTTMFTCADSDASSGTSVDGTAESGADRNRGVGAERAPCDGFHLRCDGASTVGDRLRCAMWNVFSARYIANVQVLRIRAINAHPATGTAAVVARASTWKTVLAFAAPAVLVVLAVLLGWQARARRRQQRSQHRSVPVTGGGVDGDGEE
jgi:opacity protein-like surface antigen